MNKWGNFMAITRDELGRLVKEDLELVETLNTFFNEVKKQYSLANKPLTQLSHLRINDVFLAELAENLPLRLKTIETLPEQQPILAKDTEWNEEQLSVHIQFKQMKVILQTIKSELNRTVSALKAHLKSPELQVVAKKQEYEALLQHLTSVLHYPSAYREDPVFNQHFQRFEQAFNTVKTMLERELKPGAKTENYENALQLLKIYLDESEQATRARYEELQSIYQVYEAKISTKAIIVGELKKLIAEAKMLPLSNKNKISLESRESKLLTIEKTNYLKAETNLFGFEKTLRFEDKYKACTTLCHNDIVELNKIQTRLQKYVDRQKLKYPEYSAQKDKVVDVDNQLQQKIKETQQHIDLANKNIFAQIEAFNSKAEDIKAKLNEYKLSTADISKLEETFNTAITEKINTEPSILSKIFSKETPKSENELKLESLQEKLNSLMHINRELENTAIAKEKDIAEEVAKEIDHIVEDITRRLNHCKLVFEAGNEHLDDEKLKKFKFTSAEAALYEQLKHFKATSIDYKAIASSTQIKEILKQVKQKEQEFREQVRQFNSIVEDHKKIQLMADIIRKKDSVEHLFEFINESTRENAISLLQKMSLYIDFLTDFHSDSLLLLNQSGREHFIEFIKNNPAEARINQALELLSLLEKNNIALKDCKPYMTNPLVSDTVLLLHNKGLDKFITKANLDNKPFCNALKITSLDEKQIEILCQDPHKCALILSFKETDKAIFQEIVPKIIALDSDIARSMNILAKKAPEFHQPWLVIAAQDSQHCSIEFKKILSKPDKIEQSIPFLQGIINQGSRHFLTIGAQTDEVLIANHFRHKNLPINVELLLLDKAINHRDFAKYTKVISTINKFIDNGNFTQAQTNALYQFRKEAIPMLLAPNAIMKDKEQQLCELAREKFPLSGFDFFVDTVIAMVNSAFTFLGGSKYGFFNRVSSTETDMLNKTFKKAEQIKENPRQEAAKINEPEIEQHDNSAVKLQR